MSNATRGIGTPVDWLHLTNLGRDLASPRRENRLFRESISIPLLVVLEVDFHIADEV